MRHNPREPKVNAHSLEVEQQRCSTEIKIAVRQDRNRKESKKLAQVVLQFPMSLSVRRAILGHSEKMMRAVIQGLLDARIRCWYDSGTLSRADLIAKTF